MEYKHQFLQLVFYLGALYNNDILFINNNYNFMDKKIWQILGWGVIVLLFASNIFTIYILFSQNSARINKVTEEQAQKNKESIRDKDNNQAEKPLTEKNQENISLGENDVLLEWNE